MKGLHILTLVLFTSFFAQVYAQEITGIATYKSFLKFDLKLDSTQVPKAMHADLEHIIKQQTQKEYELQFTNNEAVYKEKEKLEAPGKGIGGAMVSSTGGVGIWYKNLKDNRLIIQRDLYGKLFLIKDTMEELDWKLEKETKYIGEYVCFKATRTRIFNSETGEKKETHIVAWYTPEIPVAFGPQGHYGLPGLILEVNDGDNTLLCNRIILNPKNGVEISEPRMGKKVSKTEYEEIYRKKTEEMKERNGFPGSKTIEIRVGG
ncbi:MAG: GLPGLI family protein [Aequorivita vladivostokensis]|nr:GLPGLI family protein [Aequorivita vladivostokensis]